VSVGQLTFDDHLVSDVSIERAIKRLRALTSGAPKGLRAFRPPLAVTDHRALIGRTAAVAEESPIADLVAEGKNGDTSAMEALIQAYQARVAGFVFASVSDGQAVEDLCQTIFYKMLLALPRLRTAEKFEPWLFRIARNVCFDYLRRRRLRRIFLPWKDADDQFASAPEVASDPAKGRRIDAFRQALTKLPRRQRELIALLQDDRLSYEQLAEITNSSVSSVKSRLFRARRQLRKWMRDDL
jgi:RNA polymerase sigma-70 factor, ECF subfamily